MATYFEWRRQGLLKRSDLRAHSEMKALNVSQIFYDIRSEPFDDPSSDHHSVFFFDAGGGVFFVVEGSECLATVERPELIPFFPPLVESPPPSPLERFRFLGFRVGSEGSEGGNNSLFPFSHSRRWSRYIAIVALASVTYTQTQT